MLDPQNKLLYSEAVKNIANGDFHQAKDQLLSIKKAGLSSAPLEYNLSKAYFKTNDIGFSIKHLNHAIHLDRFNFQYRQQLSQLEKTVSQKTGTRMDHPVEAAFQLKSYLRPNEALFLGSLCLCLFLFLKLYKKRTSFQMLAACGTLIFCFMAAFGSWGSHMAIVHTETKLKETPLQTSRSVRNVSPGSRVHVLKSSGDFVEIERSKSFRGWVHANSLQKLP